ncbi:unnamed protein product [Adineta steineri]|uniref:SCP domain-containing protein n=1 Tax=Adineta steineri TaxID=433720 RepID=A0A815MD04_9BILA|nr:unnamed protein product [Adineta steineri]CAF3880827.1 unnamed protein product [Adineta steineri]
MTINSLTSVNARSIINWDGKDWAMSCNFNGNDLSNIQIAGELCGGKCHETSGCTHFTWTNYNGGTCWMKTGTVSQSDAFPTDDPTMACGVMINQPQPPSTINWDGKDWAMSCDFNGNDLSNIQIAGELCGGQCHETSECTHFTWTNYNGGTCWMKTGPISQSHAFPTSDSTMVCGVMITESQPPSTEDSSDHKSSFEQRAFELTNEARKVGRFCGDVWYPAATELGWNNQLANAARDHAKDMLDQNYFDHVSKDGRQFWDREANAGYSKDCASAENIAGNSTPELTVDGWIKSPGHCVNIMNKDSKVIGIGQVTGGPYGSYWVQDFGRC